MMSFEECQKWGRKIRDEKESLRIQNEKIHREKLIKMGINPDLQEPVEVKYDHPLAPSDGVITALYIIGMIGCLIFKDFWIPWIILTILYGKLITRHDNN